MTGMDRYTGRVTAVLAAGVATAGHE